MASFTIEGEDVELAKDEEEDYLPELGPERLRPVIRRPREPLRVDVSTSPSQAQLDVRRQMFQSSPRRANSAIDFGLAVSQDSLKTVVTQGFRSWMFVVDVLAALVLRAYDKLVEKKSGEGSERDRDEGGFSSFLNDSSVTANSRDSDGMGMARTGSNSNLPSPASSTPPEFYRDNSARLTASSSDAAFDEILREVEGEAERLGLAMDQFPVNDRGGAGSPIYRADSFLTPMAIYRNRFGQSTPRLDALADKLAGFSPTSWRLNKQEISASAKTMVAPRSSETQTGLFEDMEFFLLERVDFTFNWSRDFVAYLKQGFHSQSPPEGNFARLAKVCPRLSNVAFKIHNTFRRDSNIGPPWPSRKFIDLDKVDVLNGVRDIVTSQGYQYEELPVCTEDGYKLRLERIPNHQSNKVLYMQHGVMDSSFTWCCTGADKSLAYIAHEAGYDVFLGNFRGAGGNSAYRHARSDISDEEYWDFSVNEHAFQDIPAFINEILRAKTKDGLSRNSEDDLSIVAVAHSMGGAAVLMYLLHMRQQRKPHHLDGLLLLSPAGIHSDSPLYARTAGRAVDLTLARMTNSLRLPYDTLTRLVTKLVHDVRHNLPSVEGVISVAIVYGLGGNEVHSRKGPFSAVQQLTYNLLTCGTSTKVFIHLRQWVANKEFRAFDYEPDAYPNHFHSKKGGNMAAYGTEKPPEYTSLYHLIDVPVHLVAGRGDRLIGPNNILLHQEKMREAGVDVSFESFEGCGHADFTCGLNTKVLRGMITSCNALMERILLRKRRMRELRRKKLISGPIA